MLNLFKLCWHKVSGGSRDDVGRFTVSCTSIQFLCLIFLVSCPIFVDKCTFVFDQPPALRASPFHRKGVGFYHLYLLPQKGIDGFHHSPSFLRKEVPRRAEVNFRSGLKRNEKMRFLLSSSCHARPPVSTVSESHDLLTGHANQKEGAVKK